MEQGLSLCPEFVVQGTHENKLTMKISQITVIVKDLEISCYIMVIVKRVGFSKLTACGHSSSCSELVKMAIPETVSSCC